MIIELKHNDRWLFHSTDSDAWQNAVIEAIRRTHSFLEDGNHNIVFTPTHVNVHRAFDMKPPACTPGWAQPDFKAGGLWFSVEFRIPEVMG